MGFGLNESSGLFGRQKVSEYAPTDISERKTRVRVRIAQTGIREVGRGVACQVGREAIDATVMVGDERSVQCCIVQHQAETILGIPHGLVILGEAVGAGQLAVPQPSRQGHHLGQGHWKGVAPKKRMVPAAKIGGR